MAVRKKRPNNKRKRTVSKGRASTKSKRKSIYAWAWRQKGKGSLSRIGKKMKSLSSSGGQGADIAIRNLSQISNQKRAYAQGAKRR